MGFLDRAIRNGISRGVSDAIGKAVKQAVEPTANQLANKAAEQIDKATENVSVQNKNNSANLNSAFSNLERATKDYATEMSKNLKICPSCGEGASADKKFCPSCGTKLPEQTVAEGAVCTNCGKQNTVGTKFCQECGTKLPAAIQEEQAALERDNKTLAQWDEYLPQYPKWNCGGQKFNIEIGDDHYWFSAEFANYTTAKNAIEQYRTLALQHGFRQAGQYPSPENLYKKIDGICYKIDTEHCFEGDSNCPTIYFYVAEPVGGFDYVKPEPKKPTSFRDLFKF